MARLVAPRIQSETVQMTDCQPNRKDLPGRRLGWFLLGLLGVLLMLEGLVRFNDSLFEAASHRALTKVAVFGMHPRVDVLFLGTSRTQDGISPELVSRALGENDPDLQHLSGYNAAFTGSSLDALLALVPRFGFRGDVRVVVIELSEPQIINQAASWDEPQSVPTNFEERLGRGIRSVALIRHRKAFTGDNFGRLPTLLLFGPSLGGWETKGSQQIASWVGRKEPHANGFQPSNWSPRIFMSDDSREPLPEHLEQVANQLAEVAGSFKSRGIIVCFAVPPLAPQATRAPERRELQSLFSEVSRRSECQVWDFSATRPAEGFFKDEGHLNQQGRAHYSKALGDRLARVLKGP